MFTTLLAESLDNIKEFTFQTKKEALGKYDELVSKFKSEQKKYDSVQLVNYIAVEKGNCTGDFIAYVDGQKFMTSKSII